MRKLHPTLHARSQAVKQAHAHLMQTVPGFAKMPGPARFKAVQARIGGRRTPRPKDGV